MIKSQDCVSSLERIQSLIVVARVGASLISLTFFYVGLDIELSAVVIRYDLGWKKDTTTV